MPTVAFEEIDGGVTYKAHRNLDDGREVDRVSTWLMPNVMSVPSITFAAGRSDNIGIVVPVDQTHCRILMVMRLKQGERLMGEGVGLAELKPWSQMSVEERQDRPGDYEAQAGQGSVSLHSEEHLVTSDKGIGMQRRALTRAIAAMQAGEDPPGLAFTEEEAMIRVPSGNFFRG
jgi:hypothetical protein